MTGRDIDIELRVRNRVQKVRGQPRSLRARCASSDQPVATQKDIVRGASIWSNEHFLKDRRKAESLKDSRRETLDWTSIDPYHASAWRHHTRQKLDQCALARTVLAEDGVNSARRKREAGAVEGDRFAVRFGEILDLEHERPWRTNRTRTASGRSRAAVRAMSAFSLASLARAGIGHVGVVVVGDRRRLLEIGVEVLVRHRIAWRRWEHGHRIRGHAGLVPLAEIVLMHGRNWNQQRAELGLLPFEQAHRDAKKRLGVPAGQDRLSVEPIAVRMRFTL